MRACVSVCVRARMSGSLKERWPRPEKARQGMGRLAYLFRFQGPLCCYQVVKMRYLSP